MPQAQMK